jgi:hypothetical protein
MLDSYEFLAQARGLSVGHWPTAQFWLIMLLLLISDTEFSSVNILLIASALSYKRIYKISKIHWWLAN